MSEDVHLWIPLWIFEFMSFLVRIAIVVVLCRSQRDERCFILKMSLVTVNRVWVYTIIVLCSVGLFWLLLRTLMQEPCLEQAWGECT